MVNYTLSNDFVKQKQLDEKTLELSCKRTSIFSWLVFLLLTTFFWSLPLAFAQQRITDRFHVELTLALALRYYPWALILSIIVVCLALLLALEKRTITITNSEIIMHYMILKFHFKEKRYYKQLFSVRIENSAGKPMDYAPTDYKKVKWLSLGDDSVNITILTTFNKDLSFIKAYLEKIQDSGLVLQNPVKITYEISST